jgi:ribosomal protein L32
MNLFLKRVINFTKFTAQTYQLHLRGKPNLTSVEIAQKRLEVCKSCEQYDQENVVCNECGCFLNYKVQFASNDCPLKKWEVNRTIETERVLEDFDSIFES